MTVALPLIIPGGQRCGSTWLASYLGSHPRVSQALPLRPEPKVFLDPEADAVTWWRRCAPPADRAAQWVLEKSTSYLERPETVLRIDRHLPDARVVVILRDPVERAISNWRFSVANRLEDRDAAVALDPDLVEPDDRHGAVRAGTAGSAGTAADTIRPRHYLQRGRFAEVLGPWVDTLGDRLHVVVLEELLADPAVGEGLCGALGLSPEATAPQEPVNASADPAPIPGAVRDRLGEYYRPLQAPLEELLGRSLPWGTTSAGTPTRSHRSPERS